MTTMQRLGILTACLMAGCAPAWIEAAALRGSVLFGEEFTPGLSAWEHTKSAVVKSGMLQKDPGVDVWMFTTLKKGYDWQDYVVEFDLEIVNRWAGWVVRYAPDAGGYYFFMTDGRTLQRYVRNHGRDMPSGSTALEPPVPHGRKIPVSVEVIGGTIRHYFDGRLVDTWTDPTFSHGTVGFRLCGSEQAFFSGVKVSSASPEPAPGGQDDTVIPLIVVPRVAAPPRVDGRIEEAEWTNASLFTGFSDLTGRIAGKQTQVWAARDNTALYLAFRSPKHYAASLKPGPRDDPGLFGRDAIEINLQPDEKGQRWYKFAFDAAGTLWDAAFDGNHVSDKAWNPSWEVRNSLVHDAFFVTDVWEAEAVLPFRAVGVSVPGPATQWRVQVCRDFDDMETLGYPVSRRWTSWSPAVDGGFNKPGTFGRFLFADTRIRIEEIGGIRGGRPRLRAEIAAGETEGRKSLDCWVRARARDDGIVVARETKQVAVAPGRSVSLTLDAAVDISEVKDVQTEWGIAEEKGTPLFRAVMTDTCEPSFAVKYVPLPNLEQLIVEGDITRVNYTPPGTITAVLEDEQKYLARECLFLPSAREQFRLALSLKDVPAGAYRVATVLESSGRVIARSERPYIVEPKPEWAGAGTGRITGVPAPWTPVRVEEGTGIKIATWGKRYEFGRNPFPQSFFLRGENVLSAPMRLIVKSCGSDIPVVYESPVVSDREECGVTLAWSGGNARIAVENKSRVEFDGLIWNELSVAPAAGPVPIDEMYLEIPLKPDRLRYARGINQQNFMSSPTYLALLGSARLPNPGGKPQYVKAEGTWFSTDGWMWPGEFLNFFWIGGVDRGLFVILESPEGLRVNGRYTDVAEEPGLTVVRCYFIRGGVLEKKARFSFGIMGTPTRPLRDRDAMNRANFNTVATLDSAYYQKYFDRVVYDGSWKLLPEGRKIAPDESIMLRHYFIGPGNLIDLKKGDLFARVILAGTNVMLGNPFPSEKEKKNIDAGVAASLALGAKPLLWVDNGYTPITLKHEYPYRYEWEQYPPQRDSCGGEEDTLVCPRSSWRDYYLSGIDKLMKEHRIEGVYLDMSGPGGCANYYHGCGYEYEGRIERKIPFLAYRDLFLRLYQVVHTNAPGGVILMHSNLSTPIALYVDVVTKGEGWTCEPDYRHLSLAYFQSLYMTHRQYGVQHNFFSVQNYLSYRDNPRILATLGEVVGMSLLHDMVPCAMVAESIPGLVTVCNALRNFGAYDSDAAWVPYWESGLGDWQNGIAVSYYRKPGGLFLVLFNPGFEKEQSVDINCAGLLGKKTGEIRDVLAGSEETVSGVFRRTMGPRTVSLLILR